MGKDDELRGNVFILTEPLLEQLGGLSGLARRRFILDVRVGPDDGAGAQRGDDRKHPDEGDGLPVAGTPHGDACGEGLGYRLRVVVHNILLNSA